MQIGFVNGKNNMGNEFEDCELFSMVEVEKEEGVLDWVSSKRFVGCFLKNCAFNFCCHRFDD
jgi:hypothetical protein